MNKNYDAMKVEYEKFIEMLVMQLSSEEGRRRIQAFRRSTNFFENWFLGEAFYVAQSILDNPKISINKEFYCLKKLDMGIVTKEGICALEFKHIPTLSSDAKSRLFGPKDSNVVKDFASLFNAKYKMLTKVVMFIGPVSHLSTEGEINGKLHTVSLEIIMEELRKKIAKKCGVKEIVWKGHKLYFEDTYLVEIDVPSSGSL